MPKLKSLTTEYIKIEDRIRICGEINGNATITMWLTRPLFNLFLPHLFTITEKNTYSKVANHESTKIMEIVHQFAQEKAVSNLSPAPNVKPLQQNTELFIETVEITGDAKTSTLRFLARDFDKLEPVTVSFDTEQIRQWLYILLKCYRQAEWSMNNWPAWINYSEQSVAAPITSH